MLSIKEGFCYSELQLTSRINNWITISHPEYIKSTESSVGYWDTVYSCILQGDLNLACQMLALHSEISPYFQSDDNSMGETSEINDHGINKDQCISLFRSITSHPFAQLISKNSWENCTLPTAANISMEFSEWRHQLQRLRSSSDRIPLLLRLPELDSVFRILLGDAVLLRDLTLTYCQQWPRLALAQLLYVHPPPLSRTDLARLLQQAVVAASDR